MSRHHTHVLALLLAVVVLAAACSSSDGSDAEPVTTAATSSTPAPVTTAAATSTPAPVTTAATEPPTDEPSTDEPSADEPVAADTAPAEMPTGLATDYAGDYQLAVEEFGTMVTVTVDGGARTIDTNALADHETGEFPNEGNPNPISEQDLTWTFPATGTLTGRATHVRTTGVAVNGVKFEPGTAETNTCTSGEVYRIEAIQEVYDLGLDFNNAHVQPTGEYHYHGVSALLVDAYEDDNDLVHIGFAADGHFIYYSKSGAYSSGYSLSTEARTGTECTSSGPFGETTDLAGTTPDGTFTSDYVWSADTGDLDECNGLTIDGTYIYLATDEYPFIGRCVVGEAAGGAGTGPGGAGAGGPEPPDFTDAAAALGVTVAELEAALGMPPDLESAAAALGVTVEELQAVLPPPPS